MPNGMNRRKFLQVMGMGAAGAAVGCLCRCRRSFGACCRTAAGGGEAAAAAGGQLEIFSWWTSGGEVGSASGPL
ncbi:MAG: hypothetical protein R2873_25005 [Caldilineaceae bacterium]